MAAAATTLDTEVLIIGGGVTENWEHFGSLLKRRAEIVPAHFRNDAGIIGAATAAASMRGSSTAS